MYHARFVDINRINYLNVIDCKSLSFYSEFATHIGTVCMVFFFFMSAFWFYRGLDTKEELFKRWKKRIKTLLIPFILWSLIILFYSVTYNGLVFKVEDVFFLFFETPIAGPLWYILGLLILQLFSPLVLYIKKHKKITIAFFIFVALYIFLRKYDFIPTYLIFENWWWYENLLSYTPVYILGVYLGIYHNNLVIEKEYLSKKYTIIGIVLLIISFVLWHFFKEIKYNFEIFYSVIELIGIWFVLKPSLCKWDIPGFLNCNFYIFALHNPILIPQTQKYIDMFLNNHSVFGLEMVAIKVFQIIIIVIISILIKFIASKVLSEKANYYLTGGR